MMFRPENAGLSFVEHKAELVLITERIKSTLSANHIFPPCVMCLGIMIDRSLNLKLHASSVTTKVGALKHKWPNRELFQVCLVHCTVCSPSVDRFAKKESEQKKIWSCMSPKCTSYMLRLPKKR